MEVPICKICGRETKKYAKSSTGLCRWCYTQNPPTGRRAANWKGGKTTHKGYVYIRINGIEDLELQKLCRITILGRSKGRKRSGLVYEHHLEMIRHLKRFLTPDEQVHHLDGNRGNNTIENLLLTNTKDHIKLHTRVLEELFTLRELVKTQSELIRKYKSSAEMPEPAKRQ